MSQSRYAEKSLFLNALLPLNQSLELRTTVFSRSNLDSLLDERPVAITFSPRGVLDAERLLGAYMQNDKLFRPITKASSINKWRCYVLEGDTERMLLKALLNYEQLIAKVTGIAKRCLSLVPRVRTYVESARG